MDSTLRNQFLIKPFIVIGLTLLLFTTILYRVGQSDPALLNIDVQGFENTISEDTSDFLLKGSNCKIPNISTHHPSILPYIKEPPVKYNCETRRRWTYVANQSLVLNIPEAERIEYPYNLIHCCYKKIIRVTQDPRNYNEIADRTVRYSSNCVGINEGSNVLPSDVEFFLVTCKRKYQVDEFDVYLYRYFHAVVQIKKSQETLRKIHYWNITNNNSDVGPLPPNVVIIGLDSTSRLNLRRQMPKTVEALKDIGAIEMLGYTKVGYNTYPNAVAFLTGYPEETLNSHYFPNLSIDQNLGPFIWKRFHSQNYITSIVEDSPLLGAFNFNKVGFIKEPTDFYLRPFMLAVYKDEGNYPLVIDCIGNQTVDEVVLDYIEDLLRQTTTFGVPQFLITWITNSAHDDPNQIREVDSIYSNFLKSIHGSSFLNNTIMFFMSDHGYNYGEFRETYSGWYESKLPAMWVYIPDRLSDWRIPLLANSRSLTTPFDLFKTMSMTLANFARVKNVTSEEKDNLEMKFGQSLFQEISKERTCENSGIPSAYCPCDDLDHVPMPSFIMIAGARTAIKIINEKYIDGVTQCEKLHLLHVQDVFKRGTNEFVVKFKTSPGEFVFEANLIFDESNSTFSSGPGTVIQRLSKYNRSVGCVTSPFLQLYCYCISS